MRLPIGVRIGELSRRVGVSPETLRAWERRYGVLHPERTEGGYRVYGRADEARARRMRALIDEGWAAAQAATAVGASTRAPGGAASERAAQLLDALLRYDAPAAHAALDRALSDRPLDGPLRDVVLPAMRELGEAWARGAATIDQEHFATELVGGRLRALARDWDAGRGPKAVLACPPGERHDLGLLACGLALHRRGWRVTYLGADTPAAALEGAVGRVDPALVVLGALRPEPLQAAAPALARLAGRVHTAVGGAGVSPGLAAEAGAQHLAADPVSAAAALSG